LRHFIRQIVAKRCVVLDLSVFDTTSWSFLLTPPMFMSLRLYLTIGTGVLGGNPLLSTVRRPPNVFANQLRAGFTRQRQSGAPGATFAPRSAAREVCGRRDAGLPWVMEGGSAAGPTNGRASAALASSAALRSRTRFQVAMPVLRSDSWLFTASAVAPHDTLRVGYVETMSARHDA
jgi:hypothetical protein